MLHVRVCYVLNQAKRLVKQVELLRPNSVHCRLRSGCRSVHIRQMLAEIRQYALCDTSLALMFSCKAGSGPRAVLEPKRLRRAVRAEERAGELERSIDILRRRLERRLEVHKEENQDLRERAVLE